MTKLATHIDATDLVLGRLASHVASRILDGEEVHVVNVEQVLITGEQDAILERYRFKRDVGSQRKGPFNPRRPEGIFNRTVRGMVPYKKPHGRAAMKRLRSYIGVPPGVDESELETVDEATTRAHRAMRLAEVSEHLGAKF